MGAKRDVIGASIAASEAREREAVERQAWVNAMLRDYLARPRAYQQDLLSAIVKAEKSHADTERQPPARTEVLAPISADSFADKALAFVTKHPDGVRGADIARAIGQGPENVGGTTRNLEKRGLIEKRGRAWVATPKAAEPRLTIEQAILRVLADGKPRGGAELFHDVARIWPDAKKQTVIAQAVRMSQRDPRQPGAIEHRGPGARGRMYSLPQRHGGATAAP